ncbi:MAG: hypothetical protein KDK34_09310 [Leptospiraceae bacterium]|nr:hypothetical protein [Leptospiraceae bacterium]
MFAGQCTSIHYERNYQGYKPRREIAVVLDQGWRFWLVGTERKPVDELRLTPGTYMIGFVQTRTRLGGAARCELEAGQAYAIDVVGRTYVDSTGTYALVGECELTDWPHPDSSTALY